MEIEHVEARDAVGADVAALAAHALIAARAERVGAFAGQDHDADRRVVARRIERADHLGDGLRPERVAHLGAIDRDLRDAGGGLVADVFVAGMGRPVELSHDVLL